MTRPEFSGERSLAFSQWVRKNLPHSRTGFCVTNQDWLLYNYKTQRLMLLEEKTRNGRLSTWFANLIEYVINPALAEYCPKVGIEYRGYHLLVFENSSPTDGRIWLDGHGVDEEWLRNYLSLTD